MFDPLMKATQDAYAARPFIVRVQDRYFSTAFRFHNEPDAVRYVAEQSARAVRERSHMSFRAELEGAGRRSVWDWQDII